MSAPVSERSSECPARIVLILILDDAVGARFLMKMSLSADATTLRPSVFNRSYATGCGWSCFVISFFSITRSGFSNSAIRAGFTVATMII